MPKEPTFCFQMCLSQLHLLLWWSNLLKLCKHIKWGWFLSPWNKVERFCRSWQRLNWFANDFLWGYKIKISPSILINKKCHSYHWFLTSKYECELPNCNPAVLPPPMVIAEKIEGCKKQGEQGNRTGPRWLKCIWEGWAQWAQRLPYPHISVQSLSHVWLCGLWQARLSCPLPTPGACSNSCPSSHWCLQSFLP